MLAHDFSFGRILGELVKGGHSGSCFCLKLSQCVSGTETNFRIFVVETFH